MQNLEKLTIVVFCYNHEKYLHRALESILNQDASFEYKVIVADDASTDGSPEIIRSYAERYPNRVQALLRETNLGSMENYRQTLAEVRSEYVLINDGDDWFCDTSKLQRQVEYLDEHPECCLCFHPVKIQWENSEEGKVFPLQQDWQNHDFSKLLARNFMQTNSVMYRWAFNDGSLLKHLPGDILPGDHFLHLLHAERGQIGFLPVIMSIYFRSSGSLWEGDGMSPEWFLRCAEPHIRFFTALEKRYGIDTQQRRRFMQQHLLLARSGASSFMKRVCWFCLSKATAGDTRRMYKSLYHMAKQL